MPVHVLSYAETKNRAAEFDIAVVIDVLRASTTVCALLTRKTARLLVFPEPAALLAWTDRPEDAVVFSELRKHLPFPHLGNSPVQALQADVRGKTAVVVTKNGTLGMVGLDVPDVLVGGFCNRSVLKRYLKSRAEARIALVPMGYAHRGEEAPEDSGFAGALARELRGEPVHYKSLLDSIRAHPDFIRRIEGRDGHQAEDFLRDADYALRLDSLPVLGRVEKKESLAYILQERWVE